MTALDDVARDVGLVLADWQRSVARAFGIDLDAPSGYVGRRCGWYPERPKRRPR